MSTKRNTYAEEYGSEYRGDHDDLQRLIDQTPDGGKLRLPPGLWILKGPVTNKRSVKITHGYDEHGWPLSVFMFMGGALSIDADDAESFGFEL